MNPEEKYLEDRHKQINKFEELMQDTSLQTFQTTSHYSLDTPPDVGKVYSINYNINKTTIEFSENSVKNAKADFKVGWQSK